MIRVVVADDETSARRRLGQFLAAHADVVIVGEARNGLEACVAIESLKPDLLFLDVEMPEMSGIDVAARVGPAAMPATIFATAYEHYALDAFNAHAIDYLVKPFDQARFEAAMAKAKRWLGARQGPGRLLVKRGEAQLLVNTADIMYVSAEGNYVRLHTAQGEHLMRERMSGLLERLDCALFKRIHRSHIVNLDHVTKLLPWFGGDSLVMMSDGSRLTLSRNHRDALNDVA